MDSKTVKALVEVRMKRQELLLDRPNPPFLFSVMDEAVIHRLIGAQDAGKAQLEKLIYMADRPEITVEIVPFSAGIHRGIIENFNILEFGGTNDNDVLYFEGARHSNFSHDETDEITIYRELFEEMRNLSLGPKGTHDYLIKAADTIS